VSDMWPRQAGLNWKLPVHVGSCLSIGRAASERAASAASRDGHRMDIGTSCSALTASRGKHEVGGPTGTWQQCIDYVNGGPCFLLGSSGSECLLEEDVLITGAPEIIARFAASGRVSALKVCVGRGAAVLCGSHPEFDSEGMGDGRPDLQDVLHGAGHNASQRALLFMTLIHSLGLGPVRP
jgi:hypothetical protein